MGIPFSEFRRLVAPYAGRAGKCASAEEVAAFARDCMRLMLYSGAQPGIMKVCLQVRRGCLTLPPEVEVPIKVRIDRRSAEVRGKWATFHSVDNNWNTHCWPAEEVLEEDGSTSPLVYALPKGGSVVGIMSTCEEAPDAFATIQGKDVTGREVYTAYKGEQIVGERLSLRKREIRVGAVPFGEITAVSKEKTNGYITLFAVNRKTKEHTFLADWAPSETQPMYRRFRLNSRECGDCSDISILARVRLKDTYDNNELTIFENTLAIILAAQRINAEVNSDVQVAAYKKGAMEDILEKEAGYKKVSGNPVDVYFPLSGGAIKNLV